METIVFLTSVVKYEWGNIYERIQKNWLAGELWSQEVPALLRRSRNVAVWRVIQIVVSALLARQLLNDGECVSIFCSPYLGGRSPVC